MNRRISREDAALLLRDCRGFLARTGMARTTFGWAAAGTDIVALIESGGRPTGRIAQRARDWMQAHPDGVGANPANRRKAGELPAVDGARASAAMLARAAKDREVAELADRRIAVAAARADAVREAVAREADSAARRRASAWTGGVDDPVPILRDASPAETVATLLVETPGDLIATIKRRWPTIWSRVLREARDARRAAGRGDRAGIGGMNDSTFTKTQADANAPVTPADALVTLSPIEVDTIVAERAGVLVLARTHARHTGTMLASGKLSAADKTLVDNAVRGFADQVAAGLHVQTQDDRAVRAAMRPILAGDRGDG